MEDSRPVSAIARSRDTPGAHRRVASVGTARTAVVRAIAAAAGTGLLVVLLLLAFAWPGFLHKTTGFVPRGSTAPSSSQDPGSGGAPQVTGTINGVPGRKSGRQVRTGAAGLLSGRPPKATRSAAQPTSGPSPTRSPVAPSPSPSVPEPTRVRSAPAPTTSLSTPSASAAASSTPPPPSTSPAPTPTVS
jgi:hypothetical protein